MGKNKQTIVVITAPNQVSQTISIDIDPANIEKKEKKKENNKESEEKKNE